MSHVTEAPVAAFRYNLHHFAKAFHTQPWVLERAVREGRVEARDVLRAMAIEAADGRGQKMAQDNARAKQKAAKRQARGGS